MKQELDDLIQAAVAAKPHVDALVDVQAKVESARKDLASVTAQLVRLRQQVKDERDARAREAHEEKKRHDDGVIAKQAEVEFVYADLDRVKEELRVAQNDLARWTKRAEEVAAGVNKLEKSLA